MWSLWDEKGAGLRRAARRGAAFCLASVALATAAPAAEDLAEWGYKTKITFTGYVASVFNNEPLTNFPALAILSTNNISGFAYSQFNNPTNPIDLRFANSAETIPLDYEVEKWNTNGDSFVWVKVPVLTGTASCVWAYWGNAAAARPACTTNGATWSEGFVGVWHLGDGAARDSSSNKNDGTVSGAIDTTGMVGRALDFSGTNNYVLVNNFPKSSSRLTVSAWVWADNRRTLATIAKNCDNTSTGQFALGLQAAEGDVSAFVVQTNGTLVGPAREGRNYKLSMGQWHYVAAVSDDSLLWLYRDTMQTGSTATCDGTLRTSIMPLGIGARPDGLGGVSGDYWDGKIDEVTVSRVARSTNWLRACSQNQGSNALFNSYGAVQSVGGIQAPRVNNGSGATGITDRSAWLTGELTSTGRASTRVYVFWGASDGGTTNSRWARTNDLGVHPAEVFSTPATGLGSNATYWYRCYATNTAGGSWADSSSSFTTMRSLWVQNAPLSVNEGGTSLTVRVVVSHPVTQQTRVDYYTTNLPPGAGNATANVDYTNASGTLTWDPGGSTTQSFAVLINDDKLEEGDETFRIMLTNPVACCLNGDNPATVTIVDNDQGPPTVNNATGAGNLSSNSVLLTGQLTGTGGAATTVWIYLGTTDGTTNKGIWQSNVYAGMPNSGFATNALSLKAQTSYYYRCYASNSWGGSWAPDSTNFFTGPPLIEFATTVSSGDESVASVVLDLRLSRPSVYGQAVSVQYSATAGTATNGQDYTLAPGTVTIPAGASATNISIAVTNDIDDEFDETVIVTLSNSVGGAVGSNKVHTYTIIDNDEAPELRFVNTPYRVGEGGGSVTGRVAPDKRSARTMTAQYYTADGSARAGLDYVSSTGMLSWAPGSTSAIPIIVTIKEDSIAEGDEQFKIYLWNSNNCTIAGGGMTNVTIVENDVGTPVVTNEGGATDVQWTTATLRGRVTAGFPAPLARVYWGPTDGLTNRAAWSNVLELGVQSDSFSGEARGMKAGTAYRYRCYVTNAAGEDWADQTVVFTTRVAAVAGVANYYVNDNSGAGDVYCSAVGSGANPGTNPAAPKALLQHVLATYDLEPGDVVWIDTGIYTGGVTVTSGDFGSTNGKVVLRGSTAAAGSVLDRGDPADNVCFMDAPGAGYVRFESLRFTHGLTGLRVEGDLYNECRGVEIVDCQACSNDFVGAGIWVEYAADALVTKSLCFANGLYGGIVMANSLGGTIATNESRSNLWAGIAVSYVGSVRVVGNRCRANGDPLAAPGGYGIRVSGESTALVAGNECLDNVADGIYVGAASSFVRDNVCCSNQAVGITLAGLNTEVSGNVISDNVGYGLLSSAGGENIRNNLIHHNGDYNVYLANSDCRNMFENNTLYGGQGLYMQGVVGVTNRNNIIVADGAGCAAVTVLWAPTNAEIFRSDYNNLCTTNGADVGQWNESPCGTLSDWIGSSRSDSNSISRDPMFVDPVEARDFHLQSTTSSWHNGLWLADPLDSPSIDAGEPRAAFSNEPWYNGLLVNQGAYGNTPQASKTRYNGAFYSVTVTASPPVAGYVWQWPTAPAYPTNRQIAVYAIRTNQYYFWTNWAGALSGTETSKTFYASSNISATAVFSPVIWKIVSTAGYGGVISPSGNVDAPHGTNSAFTITPNAPYYAITNVLVDGASNGPISGYTFTNVVTNHTIEAQFRLVTWTIVSTSDYGGAISPSGQVTAIHGTNITFTITPVIGYAITNVLVDGTLKGATNSYRITNVVSDRTIRACFGQVFWRIDATGGYGGAISPSGQVSALQGTNIAFTISPNIGYSVSNVLVDAVDQGPISGYTFTNVVTNHTILANFKQTTWIIGSSAGYGGTISPSGQVSALQGTNITFTISPSNGYSVSNVLVDAVDQGPISSHTFTNVVTNHTIQANFKQTMWIIGASADYGGTINPSGQVSAVHGTNMNFTIAPDSGYTITNVLVDGALKGATNSYRITNVVSDRTIRACFGQVFWRIDATGGYGGAISPSGQVSALQGTNITFTIVPDFGYAVSNVLVDAVEQGPISSHTFTNVVTNHTILALFKSGDEGATSRGTPISWLRQYGFTSDFENVEELDQDVDRLFTWEEYLAGTIPTNRNSAFRMISVRCNITSNQVVWYATTNSGVWTKFSVYRATNLVRGGWTLVVTNLDRSGNGTNSWWDTDLPPGRRPTYYWPSLPPTNR